MLGKAFILILAGLSAIVAGMMWLILPDFGVSRGAMTYAEACASCHGADLEGQPEWHTRGPDGRLPAAPHDETGHT